MSSIQHCVFRVFSRSKLNPRNVFEDAYLIRTYHRRSYPKRLDSLYSRISPLGNPSLSIVSVLDQWLQEGNQFRDSDLRHIIRDLRNRKRYSHALEISEWMWSKGLCPFSPGDCAVHLDLIGTVRGLNAAERFFHNMNDQEKIDKTYGALLNCYVREGLIDKSLSHMQKMKEMGFASSALNYNDIMCLYTQTGQLEKIPVVLSEMKKNGVSLNNVSYRICINSYGRRSDLNSMEKVLEEMENDPQISVDWATYSTVANFYIKNGLIEKAEAVFQDITKRGKTPAPNSWAIIAAAYLDRQNMGKALECMKEALALAVHTRIQGWRPKPRLIISILNWLDEKGEVEEREAFLITLEKVVSVNIFIYI